jgi:hypothetical protein
MKDVSLNTIKFTHGKPEFLPWAVETSIMVNDTTAQVDLIDVEDEEREKRIKQIFKECFQCVSL